MGVLGAEVRPTSKTRAWLVGLVLQKRQEGLGLRHLEVSTELEESLFSELEGGSQTAVGEE